MKEFPHNFTRARNYRREQFKQVQGQGQADPLGISGIAKKRQPVQYARQNHHSLSAKRWSRSSNASAMGCVLSAKSNRPLVSTARRRGVMAIQQRRRSLAQPTTLRLIQFVQ